MLPGLSIKTEAPDLCLQATLTVQLTSLATPSILVVTFGDARRHGITGHARPLSETLQRGAPLLQLLWIAAAVLCALHASVTLVASIRIAGGWLLWTCLSLAWYHLLC